MEKIMHCPDCGAEYETPNSTDTCDSCETKLVAGSRDNTTIDGQTAESSIKEFQEGAKKILADLKSWTIGSDEAHRLERQARELWYEDANSLGLSRQKTNKIWQEKIIDEILSEDSTFENN